MMKKKKKRSSSSRADYRALKHVLSRSPAGHHDDDRLSSLPDDLLGHILSFLPTQQAVRTSQLSRRWRRVWPTQARALNLSFRDCRLRSSLRALATGAPARLPPAGVPSISVELVHHADTTSAWFRDAMARAVGSVRIAVPPRAGLSRVELPRCTRAEAMALRLTHMVDLEIPTTNPPPVFRSLAELSLSMVLLPAGTPPLHEFLSSSCPCLRTLRLCCVRGVGALLALRSDALQVLDLNNVDGLVSLHVAAANLRSLSVRSCFRSLLLVGDHDTEVNVVSAPRMEAVCWYRSYPKRLTFATGDMAAHVRRLDGLKLPALGRRDQFDFPYTIQLLNACTLVQHLGQLDLVCPDQMALLNWSGPAGGGGAVECEDLLRFVPQLPSVSVASLTLRWGSAGNAAPTLASFLSRLPNLTRLQIDSSPYCFSVLEGLVVAPREEWQWGRGDDEAESTSRRTHLRLDSLREISMDGLKGTDREERRVMELLLADAPPPPALQRVSLAFRDVAVPVVDEIADEVRARFPMATGRWTKRATSVLAWTTLL